MKKLLFAIAAPAFAWALSAGLACASTYPDKPVRVVIPWPPGGSNDVVGRIVVQQMSKDMGQQFVVDNRPGADGIIGANIVAHAAPDGYTLMVHSTTHLGNAWLYKHLPYNTMKDFTGVAMLSAQPGVLTVNPSVPAKTTEQFIAYAKARPGKVLFSTSGQGSAPDLQMALFEEMAHIKMVQVPYKGGAPQVAALLAGQTQASFATIATVIGDIRADKLRPLAVGSTKRVEALPNVPTVAQSGVPGYSMSPWIGMFAPAGTPKAIIDKLNAEVDKVVEMPAIKAKLESQALAPHPMSVAAFDARIKADYIKYGKLIKLSGAKVR